MDPFVPRRTKKDGPEAKIQAEIIAYLRARRWLVMPTHGNLYQHGFPDLYCTHYKYRQRWVEVKNPEHYSFTPAQLEYFPLMVANGSPVWILTAATDAEYDKLFKDCNWWQYLNVWRS